MEPSLLWTCSTMLQQFWLFLEVNMCKFKHGKRNGTGDINCCCPVFRNMIPLTVYTFSTLLPQLHKRKFRFNITKIIQLMNKMSYC